jgi:hypothetical protein
VHIETNDPNRPRLDLAVSGTVEKFAKIRPERVFLGGSVGTPLTARNHCRRLAQVIENGARGVVPSSK